MSLKTAAARLVGLSDSDVFFLKSLRHSWWLWRFRNLPLERFEFPLLPVVDESDLLLAARIIAFYGRSTGSSDLGQRSAMWNRNIASFQAPLVEALRSRDVERLAALLVGFLRSTVVRGIDAGDSYRGGNWRVHSLKLLDGLVSLAEQVGVARAESSQGRSGSALADGIAPLVASIEARLGIDLGAPAVGGAYGMKVGERILPMNGAEYVRVAWRLQQAAAALGGPLRVVEIGAGYGALAHRFLQLADVERYTIIDLPEMGCLQAYYLGRALGPDAVSLFGEPEGGKVRILPPHAISEAGRPSVVVNQDSLPEIPAEAARGYVAWIRDNLAGLFFSCNHETLVPGFAVTFLPDLIAEVGGLERVSRDLCWSRPGYVEEVYYSGQR